MNKVRRSRRSQEISPPTWLSRIMAYTFVRLAFAGCVSVFVTFFLILLMKSMINGVDGITQKIFVKIPSLRLVELTAEEKYEIKQITLNPGRQRLVPSQIEQQEGIEAVFKTEREHSTTETKSEVLNEIRSKKQEIISILENDAS